MKFIYLIWWHAEEGPEELRATDNIEKVGEMVKGYDKEGYFERLGRPALDKDAQIIANDNKDIVGIYPLTYGGWGGLHLQVVELE